MDINNDKNISTINSGDVMTLYFMKEKIEGHGEDSEPISISQGDCIALGVFDGMGGAGSTKCVSTYGAGHTQAYVASRLTKEVVEVELRNKIGNNNIILNLNILKEKIITTLNKEKVKDTTPPSKLRSQAIRSYPTTLAVIAAKINNDNIDVHSYWAGDSRNYLLTPDALYQLSKDDLIGETDPYDNLRNDSPISNSICIDREFEIHHLPIQQKSPCVLLCATDGCFGYFQTPMHFEWLLRFTLGQSSNIKEWKEHILDEITQVAGDDISLSLVAIGYKDWTELKDKNLKVVSCVDEIVANEREIQTLASQIKQKQEELERLKLSKWEDYKCNYLSLLTDTKDKTIPEEQDVSSIDNSVIVSAVTDKIENKSETVSPTVDDLKKD